MDTEQTFHVEAWWVAGKAGLARSQSSPTAIHFSAPIEFGGMAGRWTPEELFLAAIASCFTSTFQTLAEYLKFEYCDLEVSTDGIIYKDKSGYRFKQISIHPKLTILQDEDHDRGLTLLQKSKELCLVSRAVAVPLDFKPSLVVTQAPAVGVN